ncbi:MAG TPA: metal ABC transporter permease [Candidatus Dormibacteraeota bacterium]|nr:metal ABC transporter permease [Candidatus Dormibacteraeota bacterium]
MTHQLVLSLISGVFIAGAAAYVGTLMLSRKMAVVAGPLGHLALPGAALGLIYGFNLSLGAFPFVLLGILVIWRLEIKTKLQMEALTAIVFATGVAAAFLFLPLDKAEAALIGDISHVGIYATLAAVILCSAASLAIWRTYSKIMLINIQEDLARTEGLNVKLYNLIYLLSIAIIVALGVDLVGGLMTAALVAIPAAAARNVSRNLFQYELASGTFGVISAIIGIVAAVFTGLPAGPLVILMSAVIFSLTIPAAKAWT